MERKDVLGYHRVSRLTQPLISMAHKSLLICKVLEVPYLASFTVGTGETSGCPTVCKIIDLETGEEGLLICNAIILSSFANYGDALPGKIFELTSLGIAEGKAYRAVDIYELTDVDSAA